MVPPPINEHNLQTEEVPQQLQTTLSADTRNDPWGNIDAAYKPKNSSESYPKTQACLIYQILMPRPSPKNYY